MEVSLYLLVKNQILTVYYQKIKQIKKFILRIRECFLSLNQKFEVEG